MSRLDPTWLRHASQSQLAKLTGFPPSRLSLWMNGINRPQQRSRARFLRKGLQEADLNQILELWAADAQERQIYQQELDQMIAGEIPIGLTVNHILHGKVRQLHAISGLHELQFSHWFNNPKVKLSLLSVNFLASKFGISEKDLLAAIQQRRERVEKIVYVREQFDKYLRHL